MDRAVLGSYNEKIPIKGIERAEGQPEGAAENQCYNEKIPIKGIERLTTR